MKKIIYIIALLITTIQVNSQQIDTIKKDTVKLSPVNASYYAPKFQNRKTASGEKFNNNLLTAAHKTLPFGTKLRVTNVANGKTVIVTVNDRGPYIKFRTLDLSMAAFKQIESIQKGVVKILIEIID